MDENLARLNRIYPNSAYVLVDKYKPEQWENKIYDSAYDTKRPLNKWKNKPLSYEEAQTYVEEGYRIGWVVPKGMVVVDIDNVEEPKTQDKIEYILKKFEAAYSYNYTSKGMHILFRDESMQIKSDSKCKCALNLVIDTRANETGYIVLPCNDPHRKWGVWNDIVEEIPYFLIPLCKDSTESFVGMGEGDGRNSALFKWRTRLEQVHKLTNVQIEKSIRIINEYLFAVPMTNQELFKTVLREKEVKNSEKVDHENVFNKIAEKIVNEFDIISFGDNFYRFNGTYYEHIEPIQVEQIIHFHVSQNIGSTGRNEIIKFLQVKTQVKAEDFDKDWYKIACKNGILNLVTGELTAPTKADINTIYVPWEYTEDPNLYSPRIDEFMKQVSGGDMLKMEFLYQIAGYALLKKNLFEKFFLFKGEGQTGKSTYVNLLHKLVGGETNTAHVALENMDKDYYLASLLSKLLNIDDDVVDGKTLENTGRFKSIVSGNIISVRQIYQAVITFTPYVTCIFNCNRLPKIMDRTTGLYRRIILVELNNKVLNPDPLFITKVNENDMKYFFYKAVCGIKTALEEGRFRINQSDEELLNMFKRRQSSLHEWLYEGEYTLGDFHDHTCLGMYNIYKDWCEKNGYNKVMAMYSFKEEICSVFDLDTDMKRNTEGSRLSAQVFVKRGEFDASFRPF